MTGRRTGRRALLAAFGAFGAFWGAWAGLLPDVRTRAGLSDGALGLALAGIAVAALPAMPWAGRLADRVGAGRALRRTLVAFALVLPLAGLATGLASLVVALVLLGVATGALDVVANVAVAARERALPGAEGRLMALAHACFSFGVLAGSAAAGLARQAGAAPLPVLLVVTAVVLSVAGRVPSGGPVVAPHPAGASRRGSRLLLWLGVLVAGSFLVEDGLQSWSALHLERDLGAVPAVGGLGPALFAGAMGLGRLAGHALDERVGEARLLLLGGGVAALGVAGLVLAPGPATALAGLALAGAGTSVLAPVLYSAVGRRAAPGRQGADLARVSALGYAGFVAGPPLVGAVSAASSLPTALAVLGGVAALVALGGPLVLRAGVDAQAR